MCALFAMVSSKRSRSIIGLAIIIASVGSTPINAYASSCMPRPFTLSEAYEAADSIIIAMVTGRKDGAGNERLAPLQGVMFSFDSLEVLKESTPTRDHRGVANSSDMGCGLSLQIGKQYLLFLDSDNRPLYFSGHLDGHNHRTAVPTRYASILRQYRNGAIADLSEPWQFSDTGISCGLNQRIKNNFIGFGFFYSDLAILAAHGLSVEPVDGQIRFKLGGNPPGTDWADSLPKPQVNESSDLPDYAPQDLRFNVSLGESTAEVVRQASIQVGTDTWSLFRTQQTVTLENHRPRTSIEYGIGGHAAQKILDAMSKSGKIAISATLVSTPNTASAAQDDTLDSNLKRVIRLETMTTQIAEPASKFRACLDGTARDALLGTN